MTPRQGQQNASNGDPNKRAAKLMVGCWNRRRDGLRGSTRGRKLASASSSATSCRILERPQRTGQAFAPAAPIPYRCVARVSRDEALVEAALNAGGECERHACRCA